MPSITFIKPRNIDVTGDFTVNSLSATANLSAANIKTNNLLYANGAPYALTSNASGTNTQVQFNDANSFGGSANFTFDKTTNKLTATFIAGDGSNLANIAGANVTGQVSNAGIAGTVYTNSQPNITSLGNLTSLTITGNVNLGAVANVRITGGTNAQILSTDGNGNLNWVSQVSLTGYATETYVSNTVANLVNSAPALLDTLGEIANAIGNDASFTTTITNSLANKLNTTDFSNTANTWLSTKSTSNLSEGTNQYYTVDRANTAIDNRVTKSFVDNLAVVANIANTANTAHSVSGSNVSGQVGNAIVAGTVYTNTQPNITSVGTLSNLSVTGNITSGNANLGNAVNANFFIGNGSLLTGLPAGYTNSDVANYLPTHTGNVGANYFIGNGAILTNINGANVTGFVPNANVANTALSVSGSNVSGQVANALVAGTVYTNAQPNITSVGNLTTLTVTGITDLGAVANVRITGGSNAQLISTDGNGNLSFVNQVSLTGYATETYVGNAIANLVNSAPAVLDTLGEISNALGNDASFSTSITNSLANKLNTNAFSNTANDWAANYLPNYSGNLSSSNANLGNSVTANFFVGNGSLLTGITTSYSNTQVANYLPTHTGNVSANYFIGDGSQLTNVVPTAALNVTLDSFTGNGVQVAFTLSVSPISENHIVVNIDGVIQLKTAYSLSGSVLTFTSAPDNGVPIEVQTLATTGASAVVRLWSYTGNGVQTSFSVSSTATANNLLVTENGILQMPITDYTVSGNSVNFVGAPASNIAIQIREIPSLITSTALTANTVVNNAQPNITSVGTLSSLDVTGNVSGNFFIGNGSQLTGISAGVSNARVVGYNLVFGG
jgi:hypothetical protein